MNLSVCMIFKELSSVDKLLLSTAISGVSLNTEYTVGNKGEPLPSRNLKVRVGNIRKYLQTSRFIVLCFTVLPRNCALFVWVLVFVFFVFFFFFSQIGGLWQPCTEQVYQRQLLNSVCSFPISGSYFDDSHISSFSIIIAVALVICGQ